ncbi:MAG: 4Fe-4S dicluster domain-containing protein [Desulfobacula sp.]|nr:4Fe-4S dicluster domain-containing protein [Desulfobacula sp.]
MIKRSFFTLTQPKLKYDLIEPDPKEPESIPVPSSLILLLNEPIDSTRQSLIKKGTCVKKGEKICLYDGSTEYTISPVAGTISSIDTYSDDFGNISTYIIIKSNQSQTTDMSALAYDLKEDIASADEYLRPLPGAPPLAMLASEDSKINTIVITCADSDLLSTTRQYIAVKYLDKIKEGALILKRLSNAAKICAIVPQGLKIQADFDSMQVVNTANEYPSNLPAMVLKDHFNTILPAGKTPSDVGYCFISAEAVVSLANAYKNKTAGFEKVLTIIGKQGNKYRVKATIGTPLRKIFNQFSIHINDQDRIVIGGPMTGFATFTPHHPVRPDMDVVIVQDRDHIPELSDNPCVNCGKCIQACPAGIPVNMLVRYLEVDQYEEAADKYDLESCIECGLCAYVCTARIPLYQYIRLGKHEILKLRADI